MTLILKFMVAPSLINDDVNARPSAAACGAGLPPTARGRGQRSRCGIRRGSQFCRASQRCPRGGKLRLIEKRNEVADRVATDDLAPRWVAAQLFCQLLTDVEYLLVTKAQILAEVRCRNDLRPLRSKVLKDPCLDVIPVRHFLVSSCEAEAIS
jgi:hypothetical protein